MHVKLWSMFLAYSEHSANTTFCIITIVTITPWKLYLPLLPLIFSCTLSWKIVEFKLYLWFNLENFSSVFMLCSLLDLTPYSFIDSPDLLTTYGQSAMLGIIYAHLLFSTLHKPSFIRSFKHMQEYVWNKAPHPVVAVISSWPVFVSSIPPAHGQSLFYLYPPPTSSICIFLFVC